jgi:hypothetical protein
MAFWNTLWIISLVLFVAVITILIIFRFRRNVHYIPFIMDNLVKTTDDMGVKNYIYQNHGQTAEYIKRYIIRKSVNDDSLVCNFTQNFDEIQYYVVQYNKRNKPINIKLVSEQYTNNSSKIIVLKKSCKHVNIIVKRADGKDINTRVVMPLSIKNIRYYSICSSVALFTSVFVLRHFIIKLVCGIYAKGFLYSMWNYIGIGVLAGVSVLGYFLSVMNLRRKNSKVRNGGALEYEFF